MHGWNRPETRELGRIQVAGVTLARPLCNLGARSDRQEYLSGTHGRQLSGNFRVTCFSLPDSDSTRPLALRGEGASLGERGLLGKFLSLPMFGKLRIKTNRPQACLCLQQFSGDAPGIPQYALRPPVRFPARAPQVRAWALGARFGPEHVVLRSDLQRSGDMRRVRPPPWRRRGSAAPMFRRGCFRDGRCSATLAASGHGRVDLSRLRGQRAHAVRRRKSASTAAFDEHRQTGERKTRLVGDRFEGLSRSSILQDPVQFGQSIVDCGARLDRIRRLFSGVRPLPATQPSWERIPAGSMARVLKKARLRGARGAPASVP